jgi:RecB family exonuclease
VSPSRLDAYARCELRAVLQDVGARDADAVSASLGSLIHEIAAEAPPGATREELEAVLERRWAGLDFAARWHGANERQRASEILAVLAEWLQASRRTLRLVDVERGFAVPVGDAMLAGRVDRLEEDGDGRLVVVDLKTSKTKVRQQDVPTHPQLAAYQLAVESGAFGDGRRSGGAQLVQLAAPGRSGPDQVQPPLADSDDPEWIAERIRTLAARLRGASFTATAGPDCGRCDLQACCPLTPSGRQVTSR